MKAISALQESFNNNMNEARGEFNQAMNFIAKAPENVLSTNEKLNKISSSMVLYRDKLSNEIKHFGDNRDKLFNAIKEEHKNNTAVEAVTAKM